MFEVWVPLLVCVVSGWSWYHVLRLRERATAHARRLCGQRGLQLLDDSVALHRLRLDWRHGTLQARREYRFETSVGGNDRQTASITLIGDRLVGASVPGGATADGVATALDSAASSHFASLEPSSAPDTGSKVISIARVRRTLH